MSHSSLSKTRRGFFKHILVAAGTVAVTATEPGIATADESRADETRKDKPKGYRETEHIRKYYDSARF